MAQALYKIVAHNGGWGVLHDGPYRATTLQRKQAFEVSRWTCL